MWWKNCLHFTLFGGRLLTAFHSKDKQEFDHFYNVFNNLVDFEGDTDFLNSIEEEVKAFANNQDHLDNYDTESDQLINSRITEQEILHSLAKLKNSKSPGPDGIPNEFYKFSADVIVPILVELFNFILESGVFPSEWTSAVIIPLFKKGDRRDANNYRGISLLNTLGKIFTSILNRRLCKWSESTNVLSDCQAGFRKNHSTVDNIFVLYATIQKYLSFRHGKLYCLFVDFSKAFDRVNHSLLMFKLKSIGVKGNMYRILHSMYSNVKACVRDRNVTSDYLNV